MIARVDSCYLRHALAEALLGDSAKARQKPGWMHEV